jgi:proline iminopeptidase
MRVQVNDTDISIDVHGAQLEFGEGTWVERPTLVALHGGPGFDHGYLRPGLDRLADVARIVYPDLRGQGRSGRPSVESCTLEQMADDVAAACRLLGIERPVVLGHSAGGFVALHLALRHPGLAAGLVLCATSPTLAPIADDGTTPRLGDRAGAQAEAVAARLFGGDMSPATLEEFGRLVLPYYAGPAHMDVPAALMGLSSLNPEVAAHFFQVLAPAYDVRPRLAEITAPALVLAGRHDWVCPPVCGRAIASGIAGAELVELPESGHFPFGEEPEAFLAAVRTFVARVAPARSLPAPDLRSFREEAAGV